MVTEATGKLQSELRLDEKVCAPTKADKEMLCPDTQAVPEALAVTGLSGIGTPSKQT
jgi:hypothetical protein